MNPIDFLVKKMMLPIVETCFAITGNYGWAIVLLTVIIKMVLMPLTVQSYYSMKAMQKIQPKLKKIQERYRNKPEELNKQMMQLYREHKVNPLGGCLPMLIQMPFLIALYASLIGPQFKKMLESSGNKSFLFMDDLAKIGVMQGSTPYWDNLFMVALFGITTWLQQKIMTPPTPEDPQQAAMQRSMAAMPIIITAMFLFFPVPSGVFVYLVVSNLITIAQYTFLNQQSAAREAQLAVAGGPALNATDSVDAGREADSEGENEPAAVTSKYKVKKTAKKKKRHK